MSESYISREELLEKIAEFRLPDDTYMTVFFNGHPELVEFVLRIILSRDDLRVTRSETQKSLKNIRGHSSVLDIYAEDGNSVKYNIEIQSRPDGAKPRRARYYSSLIDSNNLRRQEDYDALPETYVIFFTSGDVFGKGLPLYTIDRTVNELGGEAFGDGEHIIYVSGNRTDDTPLGRLVHDFKCKVPSEMFYKPLAERAHDLKETNGGKSDMCQIMEELNAKVAVLTKRKNALNMLRKNKFTLEDIAECSELSIDEVKKLDKELRETGGQN